MKRLTPEGVLTKFYQRKAVWLHDGNHLSPHAVLTSGKCSNGYINCSKVLCHPKDSDQIARLLCDKLVHIGIPKPDWVIGSAYAGITFSYDVARILKADHAFAEKDGQRMSFKRWAIPEDSVILQIEELITTMKTAKAVREAVLRDNPYSVEFLPFIGTIVYRPDDLFKEQYINDEKIDIIAIMEKELWSVDQEECPLCKAGSPRYKPKENWRVLNKKTRKSRTARHMPA